MITISTDMNAWKKMTEAHKARIKSTAAQYVRNKTLQIYKFVLERTPQYTSDLVTSWGIEVGAGAASFGYTQHPDKGKGLDLYTAAAFSNTGFAPIDSQSEFDSNVKRMYELAKVRVSFIKYNSIIKIVNHAPSADIIQDANRGSEFRPVSYQLVKDSQQVLVNNAWNVKAVTLMRFKFLS